MQYVNIFVKLHATLKVFLNVMFSVLAFVLVIYDMQCVVKQVEKGPLRYNKQYTCMHTQDWHDIRIPAPRSLL